MKIKWKNHRCASVFLMMIWIWWPSQDVELVICLIKFQIIIQNTTEFITLFRCRVPIEFAQFFDYRKFYATCFVSICLSLSLSLLLSVLEHFRTSCFEERKKWPKNVLFFSFNLVMSNVFIMSTNSQITTGQKSCEIDDPNP